ncbi:hypothetical protein L1887_25731 [Cichorium endivia]|nr:hypothetical protein L1887_25731 [Cichorium endivia]
MDPKEAGRRLKMIYDIIEIAGKHNLEDAYTMLKDCNMDPNEAAQRLLYIDTFHEVKKKHDRRKSVSKFHSGRNSSSGKEYGVTNRQERVSRLTIPIHSGKMNNVAHVANSVANCNGTHTISNGSYSHKLAPESSSTSDTAVVSKNTHHTCAIGTIKCEIVKRNDSSKSNSRLPDGIKFSADQVVADSIPVTAEAADSDKTRQLKPDAVEKIEISESLKPLSLLTKDGTQAVNDNQDNQSLQVLHEPLKVTASASGNTSKSITEEKSELKLSVLEKSTPSSHQPVIFPDHLQVPEKFKNHFRFGSLDADPPIVSVEKKDEIVPEPCLKDNISSDPAFKQTHEQTKVELTSPPNPIGGFQVENPVVQSFGFMPHFVHVDVPDLQSGSPVIASGLGQTPVTQPTTGQNSISLSPPVFPYFRHPYPNYIPYNPYFPHLYLPQNAHLFNHPLFPHQPPPVFKQETNAGNQEKDNKLHSPLQQQGEDQQVWGHVPNYFYNFPQGHHVAFSPLQAASLYHSSQSQSTVMVPPQHAAHNS